MLPTVVSPFTFKLLVTTTLSWNVTLPVPLARSSKFAFESFVVIAFPKIDIPSKFVSPVAKDPVVTLFRVAISLEINDEKLPTVDVIEFVTLKLSSTLIVPVPLARNSKLALESLVLITLPLKDMLSKILVPTPVSVVVDKLLTVSVVAPARPIKFVSPFVTSKGG